MLPWSQLTFSFRVACISCSLTSGFEQGRRGGLCWGHLGMDNSLLRALSCAWWGVQEHSVTTHLMPVASPAPLVTAKIPPDVATCVCVFVWRGMGVGCGQNRLQVTLTGWKNLSTAIGFIPVSFPLRPSFTLNIFVPKKSIVKNTSFVCSLLDFHDKYGLKHD